MDFDVYLLFIYRRILNTYLQCLLLFLGYMPLKCYIRNNVCAAHDDAAEGAKKTRITEPQKPCPDLLSMKWLEPRHAGGGRC